jgi:hypothetical protein
MARPVKNYCDYFPHDRDMRNHRKIKAIRTKFKIGGYGIWCMILEYLTGIDGNVFEYSEVEFELMAGDFGVSATEIRDVLDYCIKLELLFLKEGFIQSESLDERLKPVYDKRGVSKEQSKRQARIDGKFATNNTVIHGVSVTEMPQSKVKESIVKESKVEDRVGVANGIPDDGEEKKTTFKKNNMSREKKAPVALRNPFKPDFAARWEEWRVYKKEQHRFVYKPIGEQGAIDHLFDLSGGNEDVALAIIKQSIAQGWKGFFELKTSFNGKINQGNSQKPTPAGNVAPGGFGQF